jgi:hypothetical protein
MASLPWFSFRKEEACALFQLFAVHHRVDGRALHRSVAQDIHDVCSRSAALDNVMSAVVSEAVGIHVRHFCSVAVSSQHFAHTLNREPVAAFHAGHRYEECSRLFELHDFRKVISLLKPTHQIVVGIVCPEDLAEWSAGLCFLCSNYRSLFVQV